MSLCTFIYVDFFVHHVFTYVNRVHNVSVFDRITEIYHMKRPSQEFSAIHPKVLQYNFYSYYNISIIDWVGTAHAGPLLISVQFVNQVSV